MTLRTLVNGEVRQDASCSQMITGVPELIAYISRGITLEPGDIIATGTPSGVALGMKPPVYLEPGDKVSIEISGIGELANPVAGPTRALNRPRPEEALPPDLEEVRRRDGRGFRLRVGDRLGPGREAVKVRAADDPAGERVAGGPPGQPGHRKLRPRGGQHQVAEPAAAQHRRVRDQARVRENGPHGRDPGPGVRERRAVAQVRGEDPGRR